ncbi:MAG: AraC family transcriptional regulator [Stenotrophobium sp.]
MSHSNTDPRYLAAMFPPYLLLELSMVAREQGVEPGVLCRGLGFTIEDLYDPACRVSFRQASLMIQRALKAVPVEGLGLRVGGHNTLSTLGLVGHAARVSKTFAEGLALGLRYEVATGGLMHETLGSDKSCVWLQSEPRFPEPDIQIFVVEELFSSLQVYARELMGASFSFLRLEFAHSAPTYAAEYGRVFGVPVKFGCASNRCFIDLAWLERPLPGYHPLALREACTLLEAWSVGQQDKDDLCNAVERAIYKTVARGASIEAIAQELNMSGRTLRRRLSVLGLSFESLLESVRKTRALSLLAHSGVSIEQVASETGYSDVRNFRRAFKRWMGVSPSEMRA